MCCCCCCCLVCLPLLLQLTCEDYHLPSLSFKLVQLPSLTGAVLLLLLLPPLLLLFRFFSADA
jgi:hypothetical protein